jgi:predicted deacetylase
MPSQNTPMELHVTPHGIYDGSARLPYSWKNIDQLFNQLLDQGHEIKLEPFDNFTESKCPDEFAILQKIIDNSDGKIKWG